MITIDILVILGLVAAALIFGASVGVLVGMFMFTPKDDA